jgi:AraC-like DNA-binding protein
MSTEIVDRLADLLERFRIRARLYYSGRLCGSNSFAAEIGQGFLHVMRRGSIRLDHGGRLPDAQPLVFEQPTVLFYPRPQTHRFIHLQDEGSDFSCATVEFEGGQSHPLVEALPALVHAPLSKLPNLDHALALLFAEADLQRCGRSTVLDRLFEVVLIMLLRWLLDHADEHGIDSGLLHGLGDARLRHALVAIHKNPGERWNLSAMAKSAGMSRSAFAQHFKALMQQTPLEYLTRWRMHLARDAIMRGRPLKTLAHELGYANASALTRVFLAHCGCSPRAYRQSGGKA